MLNDDLGSQTLILWNFENSAITDWKSYDFASITELIAELRLRRILLQSTKLF